MKTPKTAIRSDFFATTQVLDLKTPDKKIALGNGSSDEEVALYDLKRSGAWVVIEEMIGAMMRELDEGLTTQIETGADFDTIGKTAIIKEMVKGYLNKILVKVQDAAEAVEQSAARERGGGDSDQG